MTPTTPPADEPVTCPKCRSQATAQLKGCIVYGCDSETRLYGDDEVLIRTDRCRIAELTASHTKAIEDRDRWRDAAESVNSIGFDYFPELEAAIAAVRNEQAKERNRE